MYGVLVLLLMCLALPAFSETVIAVRSGATAEQALERALLEATHQVAGTFVVGRAEVIDGKVAEHLFQYGSGFVRQYRVLWQSAEGDGITLAVSADVDDKKINAMVQSIGSEISEDSRIELRAMAQNYLKRKAAVNELVSQPHPFATFVKGVKYDIDGLQTTVTLEIETQWSPKWMDDLKTLARAAGNSLGVFQRRKFGACFVGDRQILLHKVECYELYDDPGLPDELIQAIYVRYLDGTRHRVDLRSVSAGSLYNRVPNSESYAGMYLRSQGVARQKWVFAAETIALSQVAGFEAETVLDGIP